MKKITDAELELLKIIWKKGECSSKEVLVASLELRERKYQTINTLLDRMVKKSLLKRRRFGPIWLYTSNVDKKNFLSEAIESFVSRFLDDSPAPFVSYLLKNNSVDSDELNKIKELLEKSEEDPPSKI